MAAFFTSDTHFGHARVIEYCKRPFAHVDEMNTELKRRWNARVRKEDVVYHLGDFAMGPRVYIPGFRAALRGRIVLVRGNHDRSRTAMLEAGFDEVVDELRLDLDGVELYLHHQPLSQQHWKGASVHLCGHVHEAWARQGDAVNVGVDVRDFEPKTLEELLR